MGRAAAVLALCLLLPAAAAAAADAPALALAEKYADRLHRDPRFGWDTVTSAKVRAVFTLPFDTVHEWGEGTDTTLSFTLGYLDFAGTLGEADAWTPGRSASWTRLSPSTGRWTLRVAAAWRDGVLRVKVKSRGIGGAFAEDYLYEEDYLVDGDPFEADLAFGGRGYGLEGTLAGRADTKSLERGEEFFDLSKVSLTGRAEIPPPPVDLEKPVVEIYYPFPGDELDSTETDVDWYASDDVDLVSLDWRLNSGPWTPLDADIERDPDDPGATAEGTLTVPTPTKGVYTVRIRAVDGVGRTTVATVGFKVIFEDF